MPKLGRYWPWKTLSSHFNFSWVLQSSKEKLKTMVIQKFGCKQGALWEMCKWRIDECQVWHKKVACEQFIGYPKSRWALNVSSPNSWIRLMVGYFSFIVF